MSKLALRNRSHRAGSAALLSPLCFGCGNLAYRFGEGNVLAIAGHRCLVGALLLAPVIWRTRRPGRLHTLLNDVPAMIAIAVSGATLVVTAALLRTLTGPQSGLAIATIPLFVLCVRRLFGQHRPVPKVAVALCVIASTMATLTGGLGSVTLFHLVLIVAWIILSSFEVLCLERARDSQAAAMLVAGGMVVGMIAGYAGAFLFIPGSDISTTGYVAAAIVGVTGTGGRWLRSYALPSLGSAVASSTAQISALLTAVGGVLILHDTVRPIGAVLSLVAAVSALIAVIQTGKAAAVAVERGVTA